MCAQQKQKWEENAAKKKVLQERNAWTENEHDTIRVLEKRNEMWNCEIITTL